MRTGDALFVRGREWDTDGIEPFVGRLSLADRRLVPSGKKAVVGQGDGTAVVWDTSK